ncbi:MAG: hypothetical protein C0507_03835 [Cyanobacteria bacterium PR.3.49]|nr:hypothetical protein [Cyanobacteria bacterium PR.3.49]
MSTIVMQSALAGKQLNNPSAITNVVKLLFCEAKALSYAARLLFCAAAAVFILPSSAQPPPSSDTTHFNNEKYEESADWRLTLQAREIKDYLNFKRSPLTPVVCVTVKSQVRDNNDQPWKEKRTYETFWYHNGSPFGLRRFEKLSLKEDTHGVIKIEPGPVAQHQTKALINAALRLLPDIYHLQAIPVVLMLPHEMCHSVESDLSVMRFYKAKITTGDASALILHVVSTQPGYDRYFYYSVRSGEILE